MLELQVSGRRHYRWRNQFSGVNNEAKRLNGLKRETATLERRFSPPGQPWRNRFIESFNSRVCDESLEIQHVLDHWFRHGL